MIPIRFTPALFLVAMIPLGLGLIALLALPAIAVSEIASRLRSRMR